MIGAKDEVMVGGLVPGRRRPLAALYRPTAASTGGGVVQRRHRIVLEEDVHDAVDEGRRSRTATRRRRPKKTTTKRTWPGTRMRAVTYKNTTTNLCEPAYTAGRTTLKGRRWKDEHPMRLALDLLPFILLLLGDRCVVLRLGLRLGLLALGLRLGLLALGLLVPDIPPARPPCAR